MHHSASTPIHRSTAPGSSYATTAIAPAPKPASFPAPSTPNALDEDLLLPHFHSLENDELAYLASAHPDRLIVIESATNRILHGCVSQGGNYAGIDLAQIHVSGIHRYLGQGERDVVTATQRIVTKLFSQFGTITHLFFGGTAELLLTATIGYQSAIAAFSAIAGMHNFEYTHLEGALTPFSAKFEVRPKIFRQKKGGQKQSFRGVTREEYIRLCTIITPAQRLARQMQPIDPVAVVPNAPVAELPQVFDIALFTSEAIRKPQASNNYFSVLAPGSSSNRSARTTAPRLDSQHVSAATSSLLGVPAFTPSSPASGSQLRGSENAASTTPTSLPLSGPTASVAPTRNASTLRNPPLTDTAFPALPAPAEPKAKPKAPLSLAIGNSRPVKQPAPQVTTPAPPATAAPPSTCDTLGRPWRDQAAEKTPHFAFPSFEDLRAAYEKANTHLLRANRWFSHEWLDHRLYGHFARPVHPVTAEQLARDPYAPLHSTWLESELQPTGACRVVGRTSWDLHGLLSSRAYLAKARVDSASIWGRLPNVTKEAFARAKVMQNDSRPGLGYVNASGPTNAPAIVLKGRSLLKKEEVSASGASKTDKGKGKNQSWDEYASEDEDAFANWDQ